MSTGATVAELDTMPREDAAVMLRSCCGSGAWIDALLERRPFGTLERLLADSDDAWRALGEDAWLEAFHHHPRIGESRAAVAQDQRAAGWSGSEQAGMRSADDATRAALAEANAAYEARFGYICIICANGRSADELLDITRSRLHNAPGAELRVASDEQRQITRLRLARLFSHAVAT